MTAAPAAVLLDLSCAVQVAVHARAVLTSEQRARLRQAFARLARLAPSDLADAAAGAPAFPSDDPLAQLDRALLACEAVGVGAHLILSRRYRGFQLSTHVKLGDEP